MKKFYTLALGLVISVYSQVNSAGPITDTYTSGDTLTATTLNNIKTAVNDNNTRTEALEKTYATGDIGPAGGWVFFVTTDGLHGLEMSPVDVFDFDPVTNLGRSDYAWGCFGTDLYGANGVPLGTGARNTNDIVRDCLELTAASIADNYTSPGGHFDWYLPSISELELMYNSLGKPGDLFDHATCTGGSCFMSPTYWSSTEIDASAAMAYRFDLGGSIGLDKNQARGVRVVRAF